MNNVEPQLILVEARYIEKVEADNTYTILSQSLVKFQISLKEDHFIAEEIRQN